MVQDLPDSERPAVATDWAAVVVLPAPAVIEVMPRAPAAAARAACPPAATQGAMPSNTPPEMPMAIAGILMANTAQAPSTQPVISNEAMSPATLALAADASTGARSWF